MSSSYTRTTLSLATVAVMAAGALASPAIAGADSVIPIRDAVQTAQIGSGGSITVSVKRQSVRLSPGMVALPTTRNAWVSGVITAKVNGKDADGGAIEAGYAVGCQVDVGAATLTAGGEINGPSFSGGETAGPTTTTSTGGSISLSAGSIGTQMLTYDRATVPKPGDEVAPDWADPGTGFDFTGSSGSLTFNDQTIGVDGCAGYAQARLFVKVTAKVGNSKGRVFVWADRFSLG
ncbi:MspA family porin [Tsukamurella sp. 1534]|uniref:MspA family porin n=1 Tax=Tsukamurella sp. 1534 TaxID=1151061 RepID=UPI0002D8451F|nr:MspA family porin [Tsukamurella sp. 1534]